jgi:putative DNA primase/helicase
MTTRNTVDRARGRWREILPLLGISPTHLVNRHGPCPLCGGRDRFRFDDRDGSGSYYCNQCGPGSGLLLLRKKNGWNYKEACDRVDELIGKDAPAPKPQATPRKDGTARRRAELERTIAEATDRSIVERYLRGRGLSVFPGVLRGHRQLAYFDDDKRLVGRFPAMVAPVLGPDGTLKSAHRTYITDKVEKGKRKKLAARVDGIHGAAVRLFDLGDAGDAHGPVLGIAEGIETSIAAYELFGVPTWATISTSIMLGFNPPAGLGRLVIFGDCDANHAGQAAAFTLANRLARDRKEIAVEVLIPPMPDTDWLDELIARRGEGRAA